MTFGSGRDLSSQVVAIPMTSFGMLMNSPHSEFQRISPPNAVVFINFRWVNFQMDVGRLHGYMPTSELLTSQESANR
jgi:hypothetical protein